MPEPVREAPSRDYEAATRLDDQASSLTKWKWLSAAIAVVGTIVFVILRAFGETRPLYRWGAVIVAAVFAVAFGVIAARQAKLEKLANAAFGVDGRGGAGKGGLKLT